MTDRKEVVAAINRWLSDDRGADYDDLADRILALPDPVHEAAREKQLRTTDRLAHCAFALQRLRYEADVLLKSIDQMVLRKAQHAKLDPLVDRLRAALSVERDVQDETRPCGFKHGDFLVPDEDEA